MRLQIIPSENQKFLKEFYGCSLWKIYKVQKVVRVKTHGNCKVQKEWNEYYIEAVHTYDCNSFGKIATIRIFENECKILK